MNEKDWLRQLLDAALIAGTRTAVEYLTNPKAREQTMHDVLARLSEVDYDAAAHTITRGIDQLAVAAKDAINRAIDSLRQSADEAVEAAAERAQEQLGQRKGSGKVKLLFAILAGVGLGFVLLSEDRRNQLMDWLTGASGPVQSTLS
jgi:hypothetical protein